MTPQNTLKNATTYRHPRCVKWSCVSIEAESYKVTQR